MDCCEIRIKSFLKCALLCLLLSSAIGVELVDSLLARDEGGLAKYTVAVLPFAAGEVELKEIGPQATLLINTYLTEYAQLLLVERAEIDKITGEVELGISGTVSPDTAAMIGNITGAKVLVTGSVFAVHNEMFLVSKIIGTETSRVFAEMVSIPITESYAAASKQLASQIADRIIGSGAELTAHKHVQRDVIADIRAIIEGKKLPSISVSIHEVHSGRNVLDPAAETEIGRLLKELGFPMFDPSTSTTRSDLQITGEAFSEFGMRHGNLVSCKARVEVKVTRRVKGDIIAIDRQTEVAVDLSERIAGKMALEKAAREIAQRVILKIVNAL